MISRIIKVLVSVISRSFRLRLITLTSTLIILNTTKTSSNNEPDQPVLTVPVLERVGCNKVVNFFFGTLFFSSPVSNFKLQMESLLCLTIMPTMKFQTQLVIAFFTAVNHSHGNSQQTCFVGVNQVKDTADSG